MDIICPTCGEPWDNDSLHEVVADGDFPTYKAAYTAFRTKGCGVAFASWGVSTCVPDDKATLRGELADLLGDDSDGYASLLDDFEALR